MIDSETAAEIAAIREMLGALATRTDLTAGQVAHVRTAGEEVRAIVIGPGAHALSDRVPRLEARADAADTRLALADREPSPPPVDAFTALWTGVLKALTAPLKAFADARTSTQALLVVAVIVVVFILFGADIARVFVAPPP